jgi:hypothetical protein
LTAARNVARLAMRQWRINPCRSVIGTVEDDEHRDSLLSVWIPANDLLTSSLF